MFDRLLPLLGAANTRWFSLQIGERVADPLPARASDSPLYPTARPFRQPARGDRESVVQAMLAALEELAGAPLSAATKSS